MAKWKQDTLIFGGSVLVIAALYVWLLHDYAITLK